MKRVAIDEANLPPAGRRTDPARQRQATSSATTPASHGPVSRGTIEVRGLKVGYARGSNVDVILDCIDFTVRSGEFVAIVGLSGTGKTTLLNVIAGLLRPLAGIVVVDGETVTGPSRDRAVVFQDDAVFPWLTVEGNVAFGPRVCGMKRAKAHRVAERYIQLVGLNGYERAFPRELSGGMRKRVDLARVLANEPPVLLMDEPFGMLDLPTKHRLQDELLRIWQEHQRTVLFVTHDLEEALYLSDRVITVAGRPATVLEDFTNALPRPRFPDLRLDPALLAIRRRIHQRMESGS